MQAIPMLATRPPNPAADPASVGDAMSFAGFIPGPAAATADFAKAPTVSRGLLESVAGEAVERQRPIDLVEPSALATVPIAAGTPPLPAADAPLAPLVGIAEAVAPTADDVKPVPDALTPTAEPPPVTNAAASAPASAGAPSPQPPPASQPVVTQPVATQPVTAPTASLSSLAGAPAAEAADTATKASIGAVQNATTSVVLPAAAVSVPAAGYAKTAQGPRPRPSASPAPALERPTAPLAAEPTVDRSRRATTPLAEPTSARPASSEPSLGQGVGTSLPADDASPMRTAENWLEVHEPRRPGEPAMLPSARAAAADASARVEDVALHVAKAAKAGQSELQLRLHPAELGRVDIRLSFDGDTAVRVQIIAEEGRAIELLQRHGHELERALQQSGLELARDGIRYDVGRDPQRHAADRDAAGMLATQDAANDDAAVGSDDPPEASGLDHARILDLHA